MNVAIDLDGTLAKWSPTDRSSAGEWKPGGARALRGLMREGFDVIVHSCRCTWEWGGGTPEVERFIQSGGFKTSLVTDETPNHKPDAGTVGIWIGKGKPIATAYVDDRAVAFKGSWSQAVGDIAELAKR